MKSSCWALLFVIFFSTIDEAYIAAEQKDNLENAKNESEMFEKEVYKL